MNITCSSLLALDPFLLWPRALSLCSLKTKHIVRRAPQLLGGPWKAPLSSIQVARKKNEFQRSLFGGHSCVSVLPPSQNHPCPTAGVILVPAQHLLLLKIVFFLLSLLLAQGSGSDNLDFNSHYTNKVESKAMGWVCMVPGWGVVGQ